MDRTIEQLTDYAVSLTFEDLSKEALHECKRRIIDTLGCAMGAFAAEPSRMARAIARRTCSDPPAHILGTQEKASVELAAFANGVMVRYLDCNDAYTVKSGSHPSDTLGAILAVADAQGVDGKTVIVGTALAYEVFCNFCETVAAERGWDHTTYGVVASAAGAAKVLGLAHSKMSNAIRLAIVPNVSLEETRRGELSMWKGCAAANASRNGVFAAQLAQEGITGPPLAIEGGSGLHKVVSGPFEWQPFGGRGGPFRVTETKIKFFPAEGHAQAGIWAALDLRKQVDIEDIASITINTFRVALRMIGSGAEKWHPSNRETADHSFPYIVAAALIDGTVRPDTFAEERIRDLRLHELMQKITVREDPEFTKAFPTMFPCRMEIITKRGERKVADVTYPRGHPKNPMTDGEIEEKFRGLSNGVLSAKQIEHILKKCWVLEDVADVREVLALFAVDSVSRAAPK